MKKLFFNKEYFDVSATLNCGQIFRYIPYKDGYKVFSLDKCAYCYEEGDFAVVQCQEEDAEYFSNFFDVDRDYGAIYLSAKEHNVDILSSAADVGKGIRIVNQSKIETLFSFIISQNNNIPRIKKIIEKLCSSLGEKMQFDGEEYYSFPTALKMAEKPKSFYVDLGLGYRAEYIRRLAVEINNGFDLESCNTLSSTDLRKKLISIYGVGPKVADCVLLFGFHRSDAFPVDTWIEKVYRENFNGNLTDRKKISDYFTGKFKENSGYFQQYLFYYKRSIEKSAVIGKK